MWIKHLNVWTKTLSATESVTIQMKAIRNSTFLWCCLLCRTRWIYYLSPKAINQSSVLRVSKAKLSSRGAVGILIIAIINVLCISVKLKFPLEEYQKSYRKNLS